TIAEMLGKAGVIFLHSCGRTTVTLIHRAVKHFETSLPFVQPQLEIGRLACIVRIDRAPLDVEDAIGRSARHGRINATGAVRVNRAAGVCVGAEVIPVWEDGVVVIQPRQANISRTGVCGRKLRISIGRYIHTVEALVIEREREWQWDVSYYIIP